MSSGFVSSTELSEEKKKRQEEWERVRKAEDPLEAPEVEVCNKSLFEQLKINKDKKELEIQEERAMKNLVRGIDEDESQFLSMVNDIQRKDEKAKKKEEEALLKEMAEVKGRISIDLPAPSNRVKSDLKEGNRKSKQAMMMGSLIKRKITVEEEKEETEEKKAKIDHTREEHKMEDKTLTSGIGGLVAYGSESDEDDE